MTVLDLTTEALQVTNIIGQADSPKDAQTTNAFRALIGLVDTSNADPLKQLTTARNMFTLKPPQQIYTIGPDSSLDINAPRPAKILRANLIDLTSAPNPPYNPMEILDWDGYQNFRLRATQTQIPRALWFDGQDNPIENPTDPPANDLAPVPGYGNIVLPDQPTAPNIIEYWAAQPLTQASSLFDDLVFPAGYYEYLLYGTCIRLYMRYGRDIVQGVADLFTAARLSVESANATPGPVMATDSGLPGRGGGYWDGRTNTFLGRSGLR
jgi:hypothetical protein